MYQHPLIPLIFSVILLIILIKQCLIRKVFLKGRVFFGFILVFVCALNLFLDKEIQNDETLKMYFSYTMIGVDILVGLLIICFSEISSSKEQFNQDLFQTLDQNKLYVLVDKKNRIKEISTLFIQDLGVEKDSVYKKNVFDVIEIKYRIFKVNETDANKKDLNIYYSNPELSSSEMTLELHDDKGDVYAYYFSQSPIKVFGRFKGRLFIGDKKTPDNLIGMERNLAESTEELNLIKSRFITILEKTKEGLFFTDLSNKSIWVNNVVMKSLSLNDNGMSLEEFTANIHPDDLAMYKAKIAQINNINPNYSISYRYNTGVRYCYIKEEGSRISNGKSVELCGIIRVLDNYKYEKTNTELDNILGEPEMLAQINKLYSQGKTFQVIDVKVNTLPEINAKYGRDIGNISLVEYIKLIKNRFIDANMVYRLSGLEFVGIITDYRKMELLKNDLFNNEKILHVSAEIGASRVKIDSNMGICYSSDAKDAKDILAKSREAVKISSNPQFNTDYAYYKDIR